MKGTELERMPVDCSCPERGERSTDGFNRAAGEAARRKGKGGIVHHGYHQPLYAKRVGGPFARHHITDLPSLIRLYFPPYHLYMARNTIHIIAKIACLTTY